MTDPLDGLPRYVENEHGHGVRLLPNDAPRQSEEYYERADVEATLAAIHQIVQQWRAEAKNLRDTAAASSDVPKYAMCLLDFAALIEAHASQLDRLLPVSAQDRTIPPVSTHD